MTETRFCNSTAISASAIADDSDTGLDWERVVTLTLGVTEDDGTQETAACILLTADQARDIAQELLAAADAVDGQAPLPADVFIETSAPLGRC